MSLANRTDVYQGKVESNAEMPSSRGFVLTLICAALFLVLASLIFPPARSDSAQTDAVWLIGP